MVVPATPSYLQVLRLVAAGLASRLAFTIDEIEDLKIAVDELSAYLTGSQGRDGSIEIAFAVEGSSITITGTGRFDAGHRVRTELTDFSKMILETVVDRASLEQNDGAPRFTLVKSKQLAGTQ
ncbi:MAG TPA: anti-sigma regulatory factor [Actinomycetota bacterium]|nr:anti-sigma regulatory factor [Actinomycetota bacterium]